ncbi:transporter, dicarboxylate/amino acid:cation Na+/H+ symporter family protein [Bacteriovorax sp. BSW11_IV]|uniref:dicarboxylate/amino acid:cation symporter n=1 Tax=Bacteriovorax sp. BSW11_IV TaxID=1353529 RepID=UPI00038A0224|nr:dicarboxylate/amino acid:cation symporter [Bacteriovorax sp. BSW11_IV]EQC45810.1 transporter, dicarboxylate/amino acid:cation Na+/H+ symporter family protein [Bacteriovorax sp. BSW11_IV]
MQEASKSEAKLIGLAMLAGLIVGLILYFTGTGEYVEYVKPIGTIFVRLLKMVIIPLVFSSIFMAMFHLGTPEALGSMGRKAVAYYFITTVCAVFLGIVFVNLINPGVGADLGAAGIHGLNSTMQQKVTSTQGLWSTVIGVLVDAIPTNPFASMADGTVLQVIVFAIMFGIVALYLPKESEAVIKFMKSLEAMTLRLTHVIMKFAPIGIFVLMLDVMAKTGFDAVISLSKYMATVILGLACHFVILLLIAAWRLKKSPAFILKSLSSPLLTAFSTSSSAATLPITMTTVEENLGVRKDTAKFVLPLGATINMDGTALYESVAAIFIAQAYGIHLGIDKQIIVFMTASLAAIGAAAIPGAGLITMSIVLGAVGLPIEGIGLILAVDRILDMFRTTVNVFGDCVGTIVVDSLLEENDFQEDEPEGEVVTP